MGFFFYDKRTQRKSSIPKAIIELFIMFIQKIEYANSTSSQDQTLTGLINFVIICLLFYKY